MEGTALPNILCRALKYKIYITAAITRVILYSSKNYLIPGLSIKYDITRDLNAGLSETPSIKGAPPHYYIKIAAIARFILYSD